MPKGRKRCRKCKHLCGCRAYVCPKCQHIFGFKQREKINWKELQPGEIIKTKYGSGPYWITKNQEKIPLGYYGKFRVVSIKEDGILATGVKDWSHQYVYIYMGKNKRGITGSYMTAHIIKRIRSKRRTHDSSRNS